MRSRVLVTVTLAVCLVAVTHADAQSGWAVADCATFEDEGLPPGTYVKAEHVAQLRACVGALRTAVGLPAVTWADPALTPQATMIRAAHITSLRQALTEAYAAVGQDAPTFAESLSVGMTFVRAQHLLELRAAARAFSRPWTFGRATRGSPVATYSFSEGVGTTTVDGSGNGNTGTLIGSPLWTTGKIGTGLSADGNTSGLEQGVRIESSASLNLDAAITLSAWIRPSSAAAGALVTRPGSFVLRVVPSGTGVSVQFEGVFAGGSRTIESPTPIALNSWSHVALVYDGAATADRLTLLVNGVPVASTADVGTSLTAATAPIWLGGVQASGMEFAGTFDEVRLYAAARTRVDVAVDAFSDGTRSLEADEDWQSFVQRWNGKPVVNALTAGAAGDGQVATDCSMTAGLATLTCASGHFTAGDVGKVIAVYGAGPSFTAGSLSRVRPLSTTIATFASANEVTLTVAAATNASPSSRVVWGTDDTTALQNALTGLAGTTLAGTTGADEIGGVLMLPAGRYLVRGLSLPCSRVGTYFQGDIVCLKSYNRIWLRGAGPDLTTLENWDVATPVEALIALGKHAMTPFYAQGSGNSGNTRLANIAISDLSLHQVAHADAGNVIWSHATEDVWIINTRGSGHSYECYSMGGYEGSRRWRVHYNEMDDCGNGGPGNGGGTSALNLNGMDWKASHNVVTNSGQGVEMGSRRGELTDNVLVGPLNSLGVNVGSTGAGIWSNTISRNFFVGSGLEVSNVLGTVNRTTITNNLFIDGRVRLLSGNVPNDPPEVEQDDVKGVHGMSVISGNIFRYVEASESGIGIGDEPLDGFESVLIEDNVIECRCTTAPMFLGLTGYGALTWRPAKTYLAASGVVPKRSADRVAPIVDNGFYYEVVTGGTSGSTEPAFPLGVGDEVTDGTVRWRNAGARPVVTVRNLVVRGNPALSTNGHEIRVQDTDRTRLVVEASGTEADVAWSVSTAPAEAGPSELVPANETYWDLNRFSLTRPLYGAYTLATRVTQVYPWSGRTGWVATRGGRAAPVFATSASYAFAAFVVPTEDNGHVYVQTISPNCSAGTSEPSWPTGTGATVNSGTCVWREAGPAVRFEDANEIALATDVSIDPEFPLSVLHTTPSRGGQGAPLDVHVSATFSRALAPSTVTSSTVRFDACTTSACTSATAVSGSVTYQSSTRAAVFVPSAALTALGWYRVTLVGGSTGITETTGIPLAADVTWTFRAGAGSSAVRAAYAFSEGTGSITADGSGNGNTAFRDSGTTTWPSWTTSGQFGNALVFDGVDDRLIVADSPSLNLVDGVTFSAWVYPTAGPDDAVVATKGLSRFGFQGGRLLLSLSTVGGGVYIQSDAIVPVNVWSHIAGTYDKTTATAKLYINGTSVSFGGPVGSGDVQQGTDPLYIGWAPGVPFAGRIDELRIYGRALTPVEIPIDRDLPIGAPTRLLQEDDLVYQGAFQVPLGSGENTLDYGGTAAGFSPERGTIFLVGHDWYQKVAEISVPEIRKSNLARATWVQPMTDVLEGRIGEINPSDPNSKKIGGLLPYLGNLYITAYSFYDGAGTQSTSHFVSGLDLSVAGDLIGPRAIGGAPSGFVSGYFGLIPTAWRTHFGGPVLNGNCCLSIIGRTSYGPAAYVVDPALIGGSATAPATPLVYYTADRPLAGWSATSDLFNGTTHVRGVVFPENTRSVLFFGRQGTGPFCYGSGSGCNDPADGTQGTHAYPYRYQVWAYDALDLLRVKQGRAQPQDIRPYAVWPLDDLQLIPWVVALQGATYDPATGRIFVVQKSGEWNDRPLVHVFTVAP